MSVAATPIEVLIFMSVVAASLVAAPMARQWLVKKRRKIQ
jgi:hypothetical protein